MEERKEDTVEFGEDTVAMGKVRGRGKGRKSIEVRNGEGNELSGFGAEQFIAKVWDYCQIF